MSNATLPYSQVMARPMPFRLDDERRAALDALSKDEYGQRRSDHVRYAIDDYLERKREEAKTIRTAAKPSAKSKKARKLDKTRLARV